MTDLIERIRQSIAEQRAYHALKTEYLDEFDTGLKQGAEDVLDTIETILNTYEHDVQESTVPFGERTLENTMNRAKKKLVPSITGRWEATARGRTEVGEVVYRGVIVMGDDMLPTLSIYQEFKDGSRSAIETAHWTTSLNQAKRDFRKMLYGMISNERITWTQVKEVSA